MPDPIAQSPSAPTPPSNGAAPSASAPRVRPSRDPATRTNVIAGLEKLTDAQMAAPEDAPAEAPKAEPAAEPDKPAEPEAEHDDDGQGEPEADKPAEVEAKPADPEVSKRAAAIQKMEKRAREQIAKERAEIEAARKRIESDYADKIKAAERFDQLAKRAKHDPASVLAALGLSDDDYELAARQIYARSPAAKADPKTREAADRAMREREQGDTLQTALKQIDELRTELKTRDERAAQQQAADRYLATVTKAVGDESPLAASVLAKNPDKARAEFGRIAIALHERDGEMPEPADVIAEYERVRRAELEELGVDPATVIKGKAKQPEPAAKPRALDDTRSGTPTKPKGASTYKDKKRELLRALETDKALEA